MEEVRPLIHYIAQIEGIRKGFLQELKTLVKLDRVIAAREVGGVETGVSGLSDDENQFISGILSRKNRVRQTYRDIVNGLSSLVRPFPELGF